MEEPKKPSYSEYYRSLNREKFLGKDIAKEKATEEKKEEETPARIEEKPRSGAIARPFYSSKDSFYAREHDRQTPDISAKKEYEEGRIKEKPKLSPEEYNKIITRASGEKKKTNKIEKIIIIAIYAIVFLIAGYFIIASFYPDKLPFTTDSYEIKAGDSQIFSNLKSFYIDDAGVLGDKKEINGENVQPIVLSKKFNLVFTPKKTITKENATLYLDFIINKTNGSNIYLNEQLIFPNLDDYMLINENEQDYIYMKKDAYESFRSRKSDFADNGFTEDFIYENMPGAGVWATRKLDPVDVFIEDYNGGETLINGSFRGDLKLAVYAEDSLKINFTKQDLNIYPGKDEYSLNITDFYGENIYSNLFEDEGNKLNNGKLGTEQNFSIVLDDIVGGIYYIDFAIDRDNQYSDSSLKNIEINSNKIIIRNTFLPNKEIVFYKKVGYYSNNETLGFQYFDGAMFKTINITGADNFNITLNREWNVKNYYLNLTKSGDYLINLPEGNIWIFSNGFSSPTKSSWFDIPVLQQDSFNNQQIIVIDKDTYNKESGEIMYSKDILLNPKQTKIALRALEKNMVNVKDIRLVV